MKAKVGSALFGALILFFFSSTLFADTVVLKSGTIVEGEIVEETDEFVAIEADSRTSFFRKEEIESVEKTRFDIASGSIVEVTGAVDVLPKGETQWQTAEEGAAVNEGDSIRTGSDAKAIAVFADQVIVAIESESNVSMEKLQESPRKDLHMKVNLAGGQIWNDVGKLKTNRSRFVVTSPTAVTGVRGTVFTVQTEPADATKVAVVDGSVDVRTRGMMIDPVQVEENHMTEVVADKPPSVPVAISGAFLAQWAVYQAKFILLRGGMGAQGFQVSPTQAVAAGGAVAVGAVVAAAGSSGGGGGGSKSRPAPDETVTVTASETGAYDPNPVDRTIDGSSAIGGRTVKSVDVRVLCDPFTVPDRFQILYEGNVIGDTGMVGQDIGDPGEDILLNASASGSSSVVTIRVISGPLGTDWHWDARVTYHVK